MTTVTTSDDNDHQLGWRSATGKMAAFGIEWEHFIFLRGFVPGTTN